jgi:hypothetical protein
VVGGAAAAGAPAWPIRQLMAQDEDLDLVCGVGAGVGTIQLSTFASMW